ncbi:hypothetical protein DWF22_19820, partial [Salmonella enterica]|nr:hypothetical protein [Salmonella enterica]
ISCCSFEKMKKVVQQNKKAPVLVGKSMISVVICMLIETDFVLIEVKRFQCSIYPSSSDK